MLEPTIPGWKVETLGDDIAWMRFGEDGRLYAVNPEYGFFGVAPGTDWNTNPQRDAHHRQGQLGLHQRRPHRRRRHLVGGHGEHAGPRHRLEGPGLDARTPRSSPATRTAASARRSSSARSSRRSTTTRRACRSRRSSSAAAASTTIPLVTEARDWIHGMFMGATLSSETTAAATGQVGVVRRDPMAMLPFIGYNAGDYFNHWINVGKDADAAKLPEDLLRQLVPPRRGRRLPVAGLRREQPGAQVGRRAHRGPGRRRRDPDRPRADAGLARHRRPRHDPRRAGPGASRVDAEEWKAEIPQIEEWFEKFGDNLPTVLRTELDGLKARLGVQ